MQGKKAQKRKRKTNSIWKRIVKNRQVEFVKNSLKPKKSSGTFILESSPLSVASKYSNLQTNTCSWILKFL
jgi:hypothetical protein